MNLGPLEIQHVNLRRQLLGYDPDAVDRLLEETASRFEEVRLERDALSEEVTGLLRDRDEDKARDRRAGDLLVNAQWLIEKRLAEARKGADTILAEARKEAERILADARQEQERLQGEIDGLEAVEQALRESYRAFLSRAQCLLDGGLDEGDGGSAARPDLSRTPID